VLLHQRPNWHQLVLLVLVLVLVLSVELLV
jgi:hypothetical protein